MERETKREKREEREREEVFKQVQKMFEAVKFCRKSSDQVTERFPKNASCKIRRVNCKKKNTEKNFLIMNRFVTSLQYFSLNV